MNLVVLGHCQVSLTDRMDLRDLFHPKWFYDYMTTSYNDKLFRFCFLVLALTCWKFFCVCVSLLISEPLKYIIFPFIIFLPINKWQRWQSATWCSFKKNTNFMKTGNPLWFGNTGTLELPSVCSDDLIIWVHFHPKSLRSKECIFNSQLKF